MTAAGAQRSGGSSLAYQQSHQINSKRFDVTFAMTIYSLKLFSIPNNIFLFLSDSCNLCFMIGQFILAVAYQQVL